MKDIPPSQLEGHLGYLLRRVSNRVSEEFARSLAERGVSVSEWVTLVHIHDCPQLTPSALANAIGMTQGAVSKITDKLISKGWIHSIENETDHRSRFLSVTDLGRQVLPELRAIADDNDQRFFGPLPEEDRATLRRLLNNLARIHRWQDVPIA